jgi:hypothetical protein
MPRLSRTFLSCLPNQTNALGTLRGSYGIPFKINRQTGGPPVWWYNLLPMYGSEYTRRALRSLLD